MKRFGILQLRRNGPSDRSAGVGSAPVFMLHFPWTLHRLGAAGVRLGLARIPAIGSTSIPLAPAILGEERPPSLWILKAVLAPRICTATAGTPWQVATHQLSPTPAWMLRHDVGSVGMKSDVGALVDATTWSTGYLDGITSGTTAVDGSASVGLTPPSQRRTLPSCGVTDRPATSATSARRQAPRMAREPCPLWASFIYFKICARQRRRER